MMENRERVEWLDLPIELWTKIAKHLTIDNTSFDDVFRFRSVCKTWCSAHPRPLHTPFPPHITIPLTRWLRERSLVLLLQTTTIYRLQPLLHDNQDPSSSSSSSKGWLIMLGNSQSAPLRLLNPFTNAPVVVSNYTPQVLNFMNFNVVKLFEAFNLSSKYISIHKAVLFPPGNPVEGTTIYALCYSNRRLRVNMIGKNNEWIVIKCGICCFHDIIIHKGQVYVIDEKGTIFWMNPSSRKLLQFTQPLSSSQHYNKTMQMVEYGGILYVVEIHRKWFEEFDVKVYIVDEDYGGWKVVKNLDDDVVFVLGKECNFSLSAQDYHGIQGNCIYFSYKVNELHKIFCFSLKDEMLKTPHPFWPCPTLFD